jgi:hypothetical protein
MSLRMFHLFFIALSTILAAFVAAWAINQYGIDHQAAHALAAVASIAAACGLAVYGAMFQRKTRHLS